MLEDLIINEKVEREGVYLLYYNHFGKDPYVIGIFFNDLEQLENNIIEAIAKNKEYNEYEMLSNEDKKLYDNNQLFF